MTDQAAFWQAQAEKLAEALQCIEQWASSYPANIFGEPDLPAVAALLAAHDMTVQMDRMHASWGRHITSDVGDTARTALAAYTAAMIDQ